MPKNVIFKGKTGVTGVLLTMYIVSNTCKIQKILYLSAFSAFSVLPVWKNNTQVLLISLKKGVENE